MVEHLGHPTRQCLERWLAKDPRYAGHMARLIIPLETRTKAIELVLGGMRGSGPPNGSARASELSATESRRTAKVEWPLQSRNRDAAQNGKTASAPRRNRNAEDGYNDTEMLRRRVEELEPGTC